MVAAEEEMASSTKAGRQGEGSTGAKGTRGPTPAGGGGVGQCLRRAPWKKGGWADSRGLPRCPLARSGGGGTQKSVSTAHTGRCHQPAHEPSALFLPPPSERASACELPSSRRSRQLPTWALASFPTKRQGSGGPVESSWAWGAQQDQRDAPPGDAALYS